MNIAENYRQVTEKIASATRRANRPVGDVQLLAVTKSVDLPEMQALYDLGVRHFAENREPALLRKQAALPDDIIWHFIGPLQSNKVRKVVAHASVIHALDSLPLIERVDRISGEENRRPDVMLEVNVSGEASKGGFTVEDALTAAKVAARCHNISLKGLMTMAPNHADDALLRQVFGGLATLRDDLEKEVHLALPTLSMGMSGDFETAIACGATVVRIGSALFV